MMVSFIFLYLTISGIFTDLSVIAASPSKAKLSRYTRQNRSKQKVCTSDGCIKAANEILQNMDSTIDPCIDFYEYACGRYGQNYVGDKNLSGLGQLNKLGNIIANQIKALLKDEISPSDTASIKLAKDFYSSCMNISQVEKDALKPIRDIIEEVGGWPVLEGERWNDTGVTWQSLMYKFKKANLSTDYFIKLSVEVDGLTGSNHILHLEPPNLPAIMYNKLINNSDFLKIYEEYMVLTATHYNASKKFAVEEMKEALDFELKLTDLVQGSLRRAYYSERSVASLQRDINPTVNWTEYISSILSFNVYEYEHIELIARKYTENFTKLLSQTKPRILANYAVGKIVYYLTPLISEEIGNARFKLFKKYSRFKRRSTRERRCIKQVCKTFDTSLGHSYIQKYFKPQAKLKVVELVKYIMEGMDVSLTNAQWLDERTRKYAKEKLANIYAHVAYPEELLVDTKVNAEYKDLAVNRYDFLQNVRNHEALIRYKSYSKLRTPVTKKRKKNVWKGIADITSVIAYYKPSENSIGIPAGVLQEFLFNPDRPQYLNFAAIGTVIGHELTHGFDNNGRHFDKNGEQKNWWDKETDKKFKDRSECMVKQYDDFVSPYTSRRSNGRNSLAENISDNGGLKEAYNAYQYWSIVKRNGEDPLPGLNLTTRQLFWVTYANVWCSKRGKADENPSIDTGNYASSRFRVNVPLANMRPFAQDFRCPLGSAMNPKKICPIW